MSRYRRSISVFALVAGVVLLAWPGQARGQGAEDPLTLEQVERLVASGVTNHRVISLAARNKLAFRVDVAAERRLRAAGADDGLIEGLRGIVVMEPGRPAVERRTAGERDDAIDVGGGGARQIHIDPVATTPPGRPALSATGAALLSIPLPGVPLVTRPSPGPLVGLGIMGTLGYLAWDFHGFREERKALRAWDGSGEAPLAMTMEEADSVYDAKANRLVGAYVAQVLITYFLWDELTPHPATIQPFVATDPRRGRISAGVRVPLPGRSHRGLDGWR